VIVHGRVHGTAKAAAYQRMKPDLLPFVLDSFARLKGDADIVLIEGAGSASEVNLRANDIANMALHALPPCRWCSSATSSAAA